MNEKVTLQWHGDHAKQELRIGAVLGVRLALEVFRGESQRVVPIEESTLLHSAFVEMDEANLRGQVAYDTPYAARQHEDQTLKHDAGRTAKYLEGPMKARANIVEEVIGREIARRLR
jgi:hypothetical protein